MSSEDEEDAVEENCESDVNSIYNIDRRRRYRLKGIHSRSDTNRTGAEGLSFYYPRLLHCLNQMLTVVLLSQHRVSSSKTVRPRAPCGARCIGHAVSTWSAVCSEAPHSQFGEGARPHLCMDNIDDINQLDESDTDHSTTEESTDEDANNYKARKFRWSKEPTRVGRTRIENIIVRLSGCSSQAKNTNIRLLHFLYLLMKTC